MTKIIPYFIIILVVNFSFLFSPPPVSKGPNSYCPHQYVRLNSFLGVPVNCDELLFIGAAAHPSYLLQQDFQRQSRPGYILLGTITGYTIYYSLYPFHGQLQRFAKQHLAGQFSGEELDKATLYGSVYAGFLLINILVLAISMFLFERCIQLVSGEWKNKNWLLRLCLLLLISNQVGKTFFWTAHQQMFTILTPVLCLFLALTIQKYSWCRKHIVHLSFYSGLLFLVYGNFILLLPVILFSYFLTLKEQQLLSRGKIFAVAGLSAVFFAVPILCWIMLLKIGGVNFYSYETAGFRQFVWIKDSLAISSDTFLRRLWENSVDFIRTTGTVLVAVAFTAFSWLLSAGAKKAALNRNAIFLQTRRDARGNFVASRSAKKLFLFAVFITICFLWLLGYYADRLSFIVTPFILFASVWRLNIFYLSLKTQFLIGGLIILLHLYTVFFTAPYFSERLFYQ